MSLLSKLFGGGEPPKAAVETYKDYAITPGPQKDPGGWRIAALIEKDGRTHQLIRADVIQDHDGAEAASVNKAKQLIDQMGDRLFD
ncbi:MAG: HlyU family transcriptional regulator [Pseudomonadota bacterium]